MNNLTLHHSASSLNSRHVRIFLAEKRLQPATVTVDLSKNVQFSDWFVAINPHRQVPVLRISG